jgi:selenide,water dikinase
VVRRAFYLAGKSMERLNRNAGLLLHKYKAHAATDVTGFGILGHMDALLKTQDRDDVCFVLDSMPILAGMARLSAAAPGFRLLEGFSAETSGGLLVALDPKVAQAFVDEIAALDGEPAWIVGRVTAAPEGSGRAGRTATLSPDIKIIEV